MPENLTRISQEPSPEQKDAIKAEILKKNVHVGETRAFMVNANHPLSSLNGNPFRILQINKWSGDVTLVPLDRDTEGASEPQRTKEIVVNIKDLFNFLETPPLDLLEKLDNDLDRGLDEALSKLIDDEAEWNRAIDMEKVELPRFSPAEREGVEAARQFLKAKAYKYVLTHFPEEVPQAIREHGVDKFIEYFDGVIQASPYNRSDFDKDQLRQYRRAIAFYPHLAKAQEHFEDFQKAIKEAGIEVGKQYRNLSDWPRGTKGDILTVRNINYFTRFINAEVEKKENRNFIKPFWLRTPGQEEVPEDNIFAYRIDSLGKL